MSYSITCSTKILTLIIAPFLFISVDVLCKFDTVPGVYCLLFPQEEDVREKRYTLLPERADLHIRQHIHQKDLNLYLPLYGYAIVFFKKKHKQGIQLSYEAYNQTK